MMNDCQELRYPVGIQTFSEIIEEGYVYVDKTLFIHKLIREGKTYFLSRPRRFGKSLLLSTIEAYFKGRRELFKGLALDALTEEWDRYPILHLDFNTGDYRTENSLHEVLDRQMREWEREYDIRETAPQLGLRFGDIIKKAYQATGKQVVILVDEYDKPMLSAINDERLADHFRGVLKSVYGNLKSMDRYIKFAILTGVARFSKVSIFSDLNNLRDISFQSEYAEICGITNEEIDRYFREGVEGLAASYSITYNEAREKLRHLYDGYHFSRNLKDVYNPFSLVNAFAANELDNYWFNSGTPTYLIKLLQDEDWRLSTVNGFTIRANRLMSAGILTSDPVPALYQSGYLTIKKYDSVFDRFTLGYPNREVEESFLEFLLPYYLGQRNTDTEFDLSQFVDDVNQGHPQEFMTRLGSLLRGIPKLGSKKLHENDFQNSIYIVFKLMSFYTDIESHTSDGRIDLTVQTPNFVYLFEFKVDKSSHEAMEQIHEKEYWRKFEASDKTVYLIGANYDAKRQILDPPIIETISPKNSGPW